MANLGYPSRGAHRQTVSLKWGRRRKMFEKPWHIGLKHYFAFLGK